MSMVNQKIKLKLKSFDHRVLDDSVSEIVRIVEKTGAIVKGPIPMPTRINRITVNRSTHVNKTSGEPFERRNHQRVLYIEPSIDTVEALMKIDLAAGVKVEIKLANDKGGSDV